MIVNCWFFNYRKFNYWIAKFELYKATGCRNATRYKRVTEIGITCGATTWFCWFLMAYFFTAHILTALPGLCHTHMIKRLSDQHAEVAYQYGGNEFHRLKYKD